MGGTEVLLVNLLNHWVGKKCEVTLVLPNPSAKNVLLENIPSGFSIKYLHKEPLSGLKKTFYKNIQIFFPGVYARIVNVKASDYDLIVCFKESFYSIFLSRIKVRKVQWIHNMIYVREYSTDSLRNVLSMILNKMHLEHLRKSYDYFDEIICVSQACKQSFIDIYDKGDERRKIEVLYNAIDKDYIIRRSGQKIEPFRDIHSTSVYFISVTRFSVEKRVDRIVEAASRLKLEGYDFKVILIGDGGLEEDIRKMVTNSSLEDTVIIEGRKNNPYPYIASCDWTICSSDKESFGLTLLESLVLKTPVISTDCGGPGEIVIDGVNGLLTDNSAEGIYLGMKTVLSNPCLHPEYVLNTDNGLDRFDYRKWLATADDILEIS